MCLFRTRNMCVYTFRRIIGALYGTLRNARTKSTYRPQSHSRYRKKTSYMTQSTSTSRLPSQSRKKASNHKNKWTTSRLLNFTHTFLSFNTSFWLGDELGWTSPLVSYNFWWRSSNIFKRKTTNRNRRLGIWLHDLPGHWNPHTKKHWRSLYCVRITMTSQAQLTTKYQIYTWLFLLFMTRFENYFFLHNVFILYNPWF